MKTYNTNPGYEMDPQLLTHFNQHLDSLFGVYSKLLPFRMDFAYRKNTLSYRCVDWPPESPDNQYHLFK
ncbi:hypothetical protein DTL76_27180 [Escherichia coli]|nr:hypothetical protein [Escherichia coli]RCZ21878.1 hypothetical protein DTL76_27180 [Escherichia coli]